MPADSSCRQICPVEVHTCFNNTENCRKTPQIFKPSHKFQNHRCFSCFRTAPGFRYLGAKWKTDEQVGYTGNEADTAQQSLAELLQGCQLLSATLVVLMKPPKHTFFYLRVRGRAVQRI